MKFSSKKTYERYLECRSFALEHGLLDNFNGIFAHLLTWEGYRDGEYEPAQVHIGMDWDDKCFSFSVQNPDGSCGICGGIIFHGAPDLGYLENGSVQLSPSYGWQIHT